MIKRLLPLSAAVILTVAGVGFIYQEPASTIRSGDELTALSWVMATHSGEGHWELYPLSFSISFTGGKTVSIVTGCSETAPPGARLPGNVPFPCGYTQDGTTVQIEFSEVPPNGNGVQ